MTITRLDGPEAALVTDLVFCCIIIDQLQLDTVKCWVVGRPGLRVGDGHGDIDFGAFRRNGLVVGNGRFPLRTGHRDTHSSILLSRLCQLCLDRYLSRVQIRRQA